MPAHPTTPDDELIAKIEKSINNGGHFDAHLDTDERVLARVTDGIYRQPASALRELIANAYDADATIVSITTDCPRFTSIKISDDGIGMGPEALANLVLHIGGSAKRTQRGPEIGVTSKADPSRSVMGRRLIGKIGIGLFSVAQLTRQFTIITKKAGTNYQLLAHVTLNRFDEAELAKIDKTGHHPFRAGEARIWAEKTPDKKGHGTTIQLLTPLPRVIHILQSRDVWSALQEDQAAGGRSTRVAPLFHIGRINLDSPDALSQAPSFPWKPADSETTRFRKLVEGVSVAYMGSNHYTRLEHVLDNYFQAVWTLGLALPLSYIGKHPFNLKSNDVEHFFSLPDKRGPTKLDEVQVGQREGIGATLDLPEPGDVATDFQVSIDGIRLSRPIRFEGYPTTSQALRGPVMFVGHAAPDLSSIPETQRGGQLSFSGYFFWTPRVVPQEHNGVLIRINGASGTLFDPTFLKYQVGERRLSQLIAEVYIHTGLDGALNIDRESFNTAHPHYQVLANWVHNSLRLIRNTLKGLQSEALKKRRATSNKAEEKALTVVVNALIRDGTEYDPDEIPDVVLATDQKELEKAIKTGKIGFLKTDITANGASRVKDDSWIESHVIGVARLLEAFDLLEDLERVDQVKLIVSIVKLFASEK